MRLVGRRSGVKAAALLFRQGRAPAAARARPLLLLAGRLPDARRAARGRSPCRATIAGPTCRRGEPGHLRAHGGRWGTGGWPSTTTSTAWRRTSTCRGSTRGRPPTPSTRGRVSAVLTIPDGLHRRPPVRGAPAGAHAWPPAAARRSRPTRSSAASRRRVYRLNQRLADRATWTRCCAWWTWSLNGGRDRLLRAHRRRPRPAAQPRRWCSTLQRGCARPGDRAHRRPARPAPQLHRRDPDNLDLAKPAANAIRAPIQLETVEAPAGPRAAVGLRVRRRPAGEPGARRDPPRRGRACRPSARTTRSCGWGAGWSRRGRWWPRRWPSRPPPALVVGLVLLAVAAVALTDLAVGRWGLWLPSRAPGRPGVRRVRGAGRRARPRDAHGPAGGPDDRPAPARPGPAAGPPPRTRSRELVRLRAGLRRLPDAARGAHHPGATSRGRLGQLALIAAVFGAASPRRPCVRADRLTRERATRSAPTWRERRRRGRPRPRCSDAPGGPRPAVARAERSSGGPSGTPEQVEAPCAPRMAHARVRRSSSDRRAEQAEAPAQYEAVEALAAGLPGPAPGGLSRRALGRGRVTARPSWRRCARRRPGRPGAHALATVRRDGSPRISAPRPGSPTASLARQHGAVDDRRSTCDATPRVRPAQRLPRTRPAGRGDASAVGRGSRRSTTTGASAAVFPDLGAGAVRDPGSSRRGPASCAWRPRRTTSSSTSWRPRRGRHPPGVGADRAAMLRRATASGHAAPAGRGSSCAGADEVGAAGPRAGPAAGRPTRAEPASARPSAPWPTSAPGPGVGRGGTCPAVTGRRAPTPNRPPASARRSRPPAVGVARARAGRRRPSTRRGLSQVPAVALRAGAGRAPRSRGRPRSRSRAGARHRPPDRGTRKPSMGITARGSASQGRPARARARRPRGTSPARTPAGRRCGRRTRRGQVGRLMRGSLAAGAAGPGSRLPR